MIFGIIHMDDGYLSGDWYNFFSKYDLSPTIVNYKTENLLELVEKSSIKCWILTGSNYNIGEGNYPIVKPELFKLNKRFLCICYSHQLYCYYNGYSLGYLENFRDGKYRVEWKSPTIFSFSERYYFKHGMYVLNEDKDEKVKSVEGKIINCVVDKNITTIQFHPEKDEATHLSLYRWILKNV